MSADDFTEQEITWGVLYTMIHRTLLRFGKEDHLGDADFSMVDDNWGSRQHKVTINNLNLLRPPIIKLLQKDLADFADWEIVIVVSLRGPGEAWPDMGLIVRAHEIVDGLQRDYFPQEFRDLRYEGSKPGIV